MNCKNCGHGIELINGVIQHYPLKGDVKGCKYFGVMCDCKCMKPMRTDEDFKKFMEASQ